MQWFARRWKLLLTIAVLIVALAFAYTPAKQFHRFFLTACAASGPEREAELDINPPPVDMRSYYAALSEAADGLTVREIAQIEYQNQRWPIFLIGPPEQAAKNTLLVVAGIHGNEVSGSLAAVDILRSVRGGDDRAAVYVLAPANPVGLKHGSRYNAIGCDINRDFNAYKTMEARAIRAAIADVRPTAVIALHEGPQPGFFAIGTQVTPDSTLDAIATAIRANGFALATEDNLGMRLATPGLTNEGAFTARAKGWLGIYSLGEHTTTLSVPLITTETPWTLPSVADRVAMQVLATKTVISGLSDLR